MSLEKIKIRGHYNIRALHKTTLEITKDNYLTIRGDCIIGIMANKGAKDLNENFKKLARNDNSFIYVIIKVNDLIDIVHGKGSSRLILENEKKIILRRSNFIEDSTLMINSDKAAKDIKREIIDELKKGSEGEVYLLASDIPLKDEEILRIIFNSSPISLT
ncbi:hypothetical protein SACC_20540 [Saccharolobus caldissimus]|uniref:DUF371 domain-containing protein n=2 Tax=Saccharolobus caldissimus TaxID=1702097 RepID=A0AAQ4CTA6_9CREN|nr:DUF371 domain-containing protein [Saccharolobus caldissimus]BDB99037.1 hypothetical protein SACC_20540 [Saccharolobus caldissimus]